MIQINLLPDVKLEFIKAQRTKRTSVMIAIIAGGVSIIILILLYFVVNVLQKQHLNHLNSDIASLANELKEIPELDKILTVQNQLNSLTALHDQKFVATRLPTYLNQLTPKGAKISELKVDFTSNTITINGNADNLATVNKYVDTLKFTEYRTADGAESKPAFSEVVLSEFTIAENGVTYTISAKFDPTIFQSSQQVTLEVPNKTTTRSETQKPESLFETPEGSN